MARHDCNNCLLRRNCGSDLKFFYCTNFKPLRAFTCDTCAHDTQCREPKLVFDCIYYEEKKK